MKLIQNILDEWAYRVHNGMPNMKNPYHLVQLEEVLTEKKLPRQVIELVLSKLREAEFQARKNDTKKISTFKSAKTRNTAIEKGTHSELETDTDDVQDKTKIPIKDQEQPIEMSKKERRRLKALEKNEDKLTPKQQKELRDLRDKRDNEKVDTALHMTTSEFNTLSAEYKEIEDKIKDKTATEEDLKRKEELEEKGIGAGTAESQAGEAITHWTLRMLKKGYTIDQINEYLTNLVSNPDHVLGGSDALKAWVPRGIAAANKIIKEVGGVDNIKTISWDTPEGRKAMGVAPSSEFKTASDMFIETEDGRTIGASLKKDGQVRILSGGWDRQQKILRKKMLANDPNGELTKKKFRKTDGTLTTDKNDPDIEKDENGKPVVTTSIDEFDRQSGAHTHKKEVNAAAGAAAKDIIKNIKKEGMDGPDGQELNKLVDDEEYGISILGKKSRVDRLNPVEDFLKRMKNGPRSKQNPDGYSAEDLIVMAKILQQSDLRNRHEKHHDDMRAADNNLTIRTMNAINRDPALREAAKDFVLDSLHLDKILGLGLKEEGGVDEFVAIYGIGDDGVAMNVETLSALFGEKFASTYAEAREEIDQIKKDLADEKITREEAERRVKEQKAKVYAVIKQDLTVDYESNTIKFKQQFENPDYDPKKPTTPNPDYDKNKPEGPGNRKELNTKMNVSEYSLWDWFSRAKGLGRAVAMELQQSEFMIFALENGTADINQWPPKEQARWFNKENNKINKEEKERIEAGEKPPFKDLDKRRKRNNGKWGKVDKKSMDKAEDNRQKRLKKKQ